MPRSLCHLPRAPSNESEPRLVCTQSRVQCRAPIVKRTKYAQDGEVMQLHEWLQFNRVEQGGVDRKTAMLHYFAVVKAPMLEWTDGRMHELSCQLLPNSLEDRVPLSASDLRRLLVSDSAP
eukprot:6211314-Pleurochrysis_carterae.AAC.1